MLRLPPVGTVEPGAVAVCAPKVAEDATMASAKGSSDSGASIAGPSTGGGSARGAPKGRNGGSASALTVRL